MQAHISTFLFTLPCVPLLEHVYLTAFPAIHSPLSVLKTDTGFDSRWKTWQGPCSPPGALCNLYSVHIENASSQQRFLCFINIHILKIITLNSPICLENNPNFTFALKTSFIELVASLLNWKIMFWQNKIHPLMTTVTQCKAEEKLIHLVKFPNSYGARN